MRDARVPPTELELRECLRTLEALHSLERAQLEGLPLLGAVLSAGYSLARRAGRSLRDPAWKRPAPPAPEPGARSEERARYNFAEQAERAPDSAALVRLDAAPEPRRASGCYHCGARFRGEGPRCEPCEALVQRKLTQRASLEGRVALLTGARLRIGHAVALSLLRSGAQVHATTRFPADALSRFAQAPDFDALSSRLRVYALDLCALGAVERFAAGLAESLPRLDVLVNCAARTLDEPPERVARMRALEAERRRALPPSLRERLEAPSEAPAVDVGSLDPDGQPLDAREENSWGARLGAVPLAELLAVHAVSALAPFVLLSRLRPALERGPRPTFAVNVSSPEGQFYRRYKGPEHPHTNMAKAALNMLTRTSAAELAQRGVYLNAVDTGWVSEQQPWPFAQRRRREGFVPPVTAEDAAARVLDPVYSALLGAPPAWGVLFKNYRPAPW